MTGDRELLEAWRNGDKQAGEALFDRYYLCLVRFFRNKVNDWDDLVQQTFLACITTRNQIRSSGSFRAYLFGVAYRVLRSYLRALARHDHKFDPLHSTVAALTSGPASIVARREEERLLLEGLRHIPLADQVLLELRYWEGLKTREMADILEIPHPTVRTRLRRASGLLRQALERVAQSKDGLASTLDDLEGWALRCREHLHAAS